MALGVAIQYRQGLAYAGDIIGERPVLSLSEPARPASEQCRLRISNFTLLSLGLGARLLADLTGRVELGIRLSQRQLVEH